jgi:cell division GTPase FtsZ
MNLDRIIRKAIRETVEDTPSRQEKESSRYMFFSNLQQMRRQCDILLDFDRNMVESILDDGHDWAQDHIAEAKNNMDQVFDFLMNESKKDGMELSMDMDDKDMVMMEGRKKTGTKLCARGKAAAKSKFDVYPSAYANGYAVQVCKGTKPGLDGKKRCSGVYC